LFNQKAKTDGICIAVDAAAAAVLLIDKKTRFVSLKASFPHKSAIENMHKNLFLSSEWQK